jgi:fatty acid desaturase
MTTIESTEPQTYPPLAEVRQALRIKWYRCPIDRERLRALCTRTDKQGWRQAGGHTALYLALAGITVVFWSQQNWWLFLVGLWCVGFVATFFKGTAAHELGHGTVFKTQSLNTIFLHIVCMISWWDPYDYAASHTYHHRYTTHREADRENLLPLTPSLHPWLVLQLLTFNLFSKPNRNFSKGGFLWTLYLTGRTALGKPAGHTDIPSQEWLKTLHEDQPEQFKRSVRWSRALLIFHVSVLVLSVVTGWWVLPLVITLPSYIANIGSYLLGTTQHCGLRQNTSDFRQNTRSITINPLLSFLYWHMNWHIEHHMYAGVPCFNLKALARELEPDMPQPRTLLGAWKEMREIQAKQAQDPNYEYHTPVPVAAASTTMPVDDELVSSIGDLAPKEF